MGTATTTTSSARAAVVLLAAASGSAAASADCAGATAPHDDDVADPDDEDNRYSALRVPRDGGGGGGGSSATTRTVPPNCAICLLQYRPGNYVMWSSNGECRHVFHRDCILTWLLRKDDALCRYQCPCCRGEFVSASLLSESSPITR